MIELETCIIGFYLLASHLERNLKAFKFPLASLLHSVMVPFIVSTTLRLRHTE
jgi:hypothetical protein